MYRRDSGISIPRLRGSARLAAGWAERGLVGVAEEGAEMAFGALAAADLPVVAAAAVPALIASSMSTDFDVAMDFVNNSPLFPQKRMKVSAQQMVNAQANKAAVSKTKPAPMKRDKVVKVSKRLREKVKEVIEDEKCAGTFIETQTGVIVRQYSRQNNDGSWWRTGYIEFQDEKIALQDNNEMPFRGCSWSQALIPFINCNVSAPTANTNVVNYFWNDYSGTDSHYNLTYFSPGYVWDKISKQYGLKDYNEEIRFTSNNLSGRANVATGAGERTPRGLKVRVENSYVELSLNNVSQRRQTLEIYVCVPKKAWHPTYPLETLFRGAENMFVDAENNMLDVQNKTWTRRQKINYLLHSDMVTPSCVNEFKAAFNTQKIVVTMAPGERCFQTIQGPKNTVYDFTAICAKAEGFLNESDSRLMPGVFKGLGFTLLIKQVTDEQLAINTNGTDRTGPVNVPGAWTNQPAFSQLLTDGEFGCPVSVQTKAYLRYTMPEIAGGYNNGNAVFTTNNDRKDKLTMVSFPDFILNNGQTENRRVTYDVFDEENPLQTSSNIGIGSMRK
jgi:hypothetical protein